MSSELVEDRKEGALGSLLQRVRKEGALGSLLQRVLKIKIKERDIAQSRFAQFQNVLDNCRAIQNSQSFEGKEEEVTHTK